MSTYSNRIRELRKNKSLSQEQLADKLGVTKQAVSQMERGARKPSVTMLEALCDFFNVSTDYLLGKEDVTIRLVDNKDINRLDSPQSVRVPVFDRVAAGIPLDAIENIIDWEELSTRTVRGYEVFGLRVKGDSMQPRIADGDVVIVRKQPDAESGDIVIVRINGDFATCKRLVKYKGGISLISFNPAYPPMNYSNDEIKSVPVEIIGKVIENRQKY